MESIKLKTSWLKALPLSLLFFAIFGIDVAQAATLTVNEYVDGSEAGNTSGTCNLREAIQTINDGADIVGDCVAVGAYGTADQIIFTGAFPQTYTLTFDAGGGVAHPLILDNDVTITGPGSGSLTIDGNDEAGIFLLGAQFSGAGINLTLSGVTLFDGNATSTAANYFYYAGEGGGIHGQIGSTLSLDDVTISSSTAGIGGGIYVDDNSVVTIQNSSILSNDATSARGGGISADNAVTSLTVRNSIIDGNRSFDDLGGGIYSQADLTDIRLSTISNNTGNSTSAGFGGGGGVYVGDQGLGGAAVNQFILIDSRMIGNSTPGAADEGGGAYSQSGSSYVSNTEFSGNSAGRGGGAMTINQSNAVVVNNTFSNNTTVTGEGTFKVGSTAFIYFIHNTITNNSTVGASGSAGLYFGNAGSAHFISNVIAENTGPGDNDDCRTFLATLTTGGYNVIGVNDGCSGFLTPAGTDNIGTSGVPVTAGLSALADNGGPSSPTLTPQTHEATVASTNVWEIIPAATCATTFNPANYGAGGSIVNTTTHSFGADITTLFAATTALDQRGIARPGMVSCEVGAFENVTPATFDFGDAPDTYGTLTASTGPSHTINANIQIGTNIDSDTDGFNDGVDDNLDATDDDTEGSTPDDEDGAAAFPVLTTIDTTYSEDVTVTNNTGSAAVLFGWIDFDLNSTFDLDEATSVAVPDGTTAGVVALNWAAVPGDIAAGTSYIRLRLTTDGAITTATPGGVANDGEVEDYLITIEAGLAAPSGGTDSGDISSSGPGGGSGANNRGGKAHPCLGLTTQACRMIVSPTPEKEDALSSSLLAKVYKVTSSFVDFDINQKSAHYIWSFFKISLGSK